MILVYLSTEALVPPNETGAALQEWFRSAHTARREPAEEAASSEGPAKAEISKEPP